MWGVATDNTSFLPPPLRSCFSTKQIFITDVRVSLLVCVFELQYLFNQTFVSKWIYVLIRGNPFVYLLLSQREAYKKYDYAMLWIIWTEKTHGCFWMPFIFFPFNCPFRVQCTFLFCISFAFCSIFFPSKPERRHGPTSCLRLELVREISQAETGSASLCFWMWFLIGSDMDTLAGYRI